MRKKWKVPSLDMLDISMTAKGNDGTFNPPGKGLGHCKNYPNPGHIGDEANGPAHPYFEGKCYS